MLDIQLIRRDPEFVASALLKRGVQFDLKKFNKLEETRRKVQVKTEKLQNEKHKKPPIRISCVSS